MKKPLLNLTRTWALTFCLLFPLQRGAAQFVELTAEIELNGWHFWFFEDETNQSARRGTAPKSIFSKTYKVRCLVGTNTWMMEGDFIANADATYWFTSTNLIIHTVTTKQLPDPPKSQNSFVGVSSPVGQRSTRVYESAEGNPGPPRHAEHILDTRERIAWMAFCSGSFLKRFGRMVPPATDDWKHQIRAPGFLDKTVVFEDALGLPKAIKLFAPNDQLLFQYQAHESTNVLGWNFPLEFYLVEHRPVNWPRTNGWELNLTAKGRISSIKEGTKPEIPADVLKAVEESKHR